MRVRMLTLMAGPGGTFPPGSVRDLPDGEAYELIEGRYAEQLDFAPPAVEPKPVEPPALETLTKAELVALAKAELELDLDPEAKKAAMVAAIEAARAEKAKA
ncbi:MAG: hypothetical protein O9320_08810 [Magnetospirillum sp.]|nr:hypothetical protein [Magnetospirillum sp.]